MANKNKPKGKCHSVSDQWTMNWLYYNGRFGQFSKTTSIPWGFGPVMTAGKACITEDRKVGASDILKRSNNGQMINYHDGKLSPVIHQYDRCGEWMERYIDTLNLRISE